MKKEDFINNSNKIIEEKSNYLLNEFKKGKKFVEALEPYSKKFWLKVIFLEFHFLIIIAFIDKIVEDKFLNKKLKSEFGNVDKFYSSIKKCELCIFTLFDEIEKLNIYDFKN